MVADATSAPPTLPNLQPLAPPYVSVGSAAGPLDPFELVSAPVPGPPVLRFPTYAMNVGAHALELVGSPTTTSPFVWSADQCVSWVEKVCRAREAVGEFVWHPQHNHFHFADFATYELRRLTSSGTPDFSSAGLLASSPKVSFCLQDTEMNRADAPPPTYVGCAGALQGISAGWTDLYDTGLPGQHLPIAGLSDGEYAIVITLNPDGMLRETSLDDNRAYSVVRLYDGGSQARVIGGGTA